MEPRNGEIFAMGPTRGSTRTNFTKPHRTNSTDDRAGRDGCHERRARPPLIDSATESAYPTGSAFKPIIAMGASKRGFSAPKPRSARARASTVGNEQFRNAGKVEYGALGLVEALEVSEDTFFFHVGGWTTANGPVIQHMAHELGIGDPIHIDLPGNAGTVPDQKWLRRPRSICEATSRASVAATPCEIIAEPGEHWTVGTTRTWRSARANCRRPAADGGRLLHARQRLPQRRPRPARDPAPGARGRKPRGGIVKR